MNDTAGYKAILEEEKTRLEQELSSIGRRNPANPSDWEALPEETGLEADTLDTAEQIDGYEANTAILKDLEIRYNEVVAALLRIEQGTYGICTVSGEEIEAERLAADPAAQTCKAHLNN
jgi:RNA polymerase-binding transcription factor DksA